MVKIRKTFCHFSTETMGKYLNFPLKWKSRHHRFTHTLVNLSVCKKFRSVGPGFCHGGLALKAKSGQYSEVNSHE